MTPKVRKAVALDKQADDHARTCADCYRAVMDVTAPTSDTVRSLGRELAALQRRFTPAERSDYHDATFDVAWGNRP